MLETTGRMFDVVNTLEGYTVEFVVGFKDVLKAEWPIFLNC